jgi:uncharacterized protein YuzE
MEAVKIFEKSEKINWDYDEDADVLYLSIDEPRSALGVDVGDGVILRYDEVNKELVGLTLIGLRAKLMSNIPIKTEIK